MMTNSKNRENDKKTEQMVRAIQAGDNVKAYKCLESLVKDRIAKKIDEAIDD